MEAKADRDNLRVWVTACSTGEEAYSIGIILREVIEETGKNLQVQIFGSDINEDAINLARAGEYPHGDRGRRQTPSAWRSSSSSSRTGYKLKKEVREMVIFAPHDVIQDPPFLHLDLLSCRNLLIYFEPVLQRRVLEVFSAALNSNGIMFLGESETINGYHDRFHGRRPEMEDLSERHFHPATRICRGLGSRAPSEQEKGSGRMRTNGEGLHH
jgi:two-component system CheB/CheR fusion protein